ncbi:MAG: hypothetical protein BVN35_17885 [Proteobacteria bacterium ST_bin11]|nr:MAG: hypothetical protein BVN35_17885 [Proteobacteria bacterium ST_bin11]
MLRTLTAVLFLLLLPLHSSSAASLVTDANGILTGARDIEYLGNKYDVFIGDGSCVGLFDGCDAQSDFPFQASDSLGASSALLALIVSDGRFTFDPLRISGCSSDSCAIHLPFLRLTQDVLADTIFILPSNSPLQAIDRLFVSDNTAVFIESTYAVWTQQPTTTVPEPSTLMLLGIGLLGQRWLRTGTKRLPA